MLTRSAANPSLERTHYPPPVPPARDNNINIKQRNALPVHYHQRADEIKRDIADKSSTTADTNEKLNEKSHLQSKQASALDDFISSERAKSDALPTRNQTDICPACKLAVLHGQDGLNCEICKSWYHPKCQDISPMEYRHLQDDTFDIPFYCWRCESTRISSSTLPPPDHLSPITTAKWGILEGIEIKETVDSIYTRVVKWKKNMFKVPKGKVGESFIEEVTNSISMFNNGSKMESVALTITTIMFPLLLQKPSRTSKSKDHTKHLERRLQLWKNGEIEKLARR